MDELQVTINGQALTTAQAISVRVAIAAYHDEMQNPDALGTDKNGRNITAAYSYRLGEVIKIYS